MSENGNKTSATTLAPSDDLKIPKDYKEHFRVCLGFFGLLDDCYLFELFFSYLFFY